MALSFGYERLKDGTLKVTHPFVGKEIWTVPGRGGRPITNAHEWNASNLAWGQRTDPSCHFCPENLHRTPAEKSRLVEKDGSYSQVDFLLPEQARLEKAAFRRVPNLYEIVPYDYWVKNHQRSLSQNQTLRKKKYLLDPAGKQHLLGVLSDKLSRLGKSQAAIENMGESLFDEADSFFGGSHDLIIAGSHYRSSAQTNADLLSSGDLNLADHLAFLNFTFESAQELENEHPEIVQVSIYQNWLAPAGASFDHLHKQVLGIDTISPAMKRRIEATDRDSNFFNQQLFGLVRREGLVLAENNHAIAIVEPGHVHPCLAVYSKAAAGRWQELTGEEKKDFSELLWVSHKLSGSNMPINEEWYQAPQGKSAIPLHVLLKWRMNIPAGLEGGSEIYLSPAFPEEMLEALLAKEKPQLQGVRWGSDCSAEEGCLKAGS